LQVEGAEGTAALEIHEIRPEGEEGKKRTRASQKTPITISIPYSLDPCFCSSCNLHTTQEVGGIFELVVIPFTKRFPTAILVAERFSAPVPEDRVLLGQRHNRMF